MCAVIFSAQLVDEFKNTLRLKLNNEYYWSDSEIILNWIKSNHNTSTRSIISKRVIEMQAFHSKGGGGKLSSAYSDNGTNYVRANSEFLELANCLKLCSDNINLLRIAKNLNNSATLLKYICYH